MWTKDGVGVQYDSIYTRHQYLLNGSDAKYHSFLSASAAPENLIGEYACIVRDSLGHNSQPSKIMFNGIVFPVKHTVSSLIILQVCR